MPANPSTPGFKSIAPADAGLPLYRLVKRALLQAIESGHCRPGEALPSEWQLSRQFGVSIGTVRRAVDDLVADHILLRMQGRGTFVATHTQDRFLFQFFHVERTDGLAEAPAVDLVSFARRRAGEDEAMALRLRPGDQVFEVENRLLLQGRAVVYDRLTLPAQLYKGLSERRFQQRPGTIYQLYQSEFGITVVQSLERVRAASADSRAARVIGLALGAPVLQIRRTALTFGERPVEYRVSTVDTRHHEYVNRLSRPAR